MYKIEPYLDGDEHFNNVFQQQLTRVKLTTSTASDEQ